jgi:AcrR family transcriptional regulator
MGIAERKERQRSELRDQILAAARRIVIDGGFAALTMRKIADAIEYSPGTLYLYFKSREEIALELCRAGFATLLAALGPAAAIADPVERLRDIGRRYVAFAMREPETYRLIFMDDPAFMREVFGEGSAAGDDPGADAYAFLEQTVAECVTAGAFRPLDPHRAAQLLWAGVHGVASLKISCDEMMDGDAIEIVDTMSDALLSGFLKR